MNVSPPASMADIIGQQQALAQYAKVPRQPQNVSASNRESKKKARVPKPAAMGTAATGGRAQQMPG